MIENIYMNIFNYDSNKYFRKFCFINMANIIYYLSKPDGKGKIEKNYFHNSE